jgi:CBS domain-containing protein
MITVEEVMTTDVQTLPDTATLMDAIRVMTEHQIRHVPIVSKTNQLMGLVTHRDVLAATDSKLRDPDERLNPESFALRELMKTDVLTVDPEDSLRSAALEMEKHRYGCVPVTVDGELLGIITETDFVGVAINLLEQLEDSDSDEDDGFEEEVDVGVDVGEENG